MIPSTSYTVTASNGSCSSTASSLFSINAQLTVPTAPMISTIVATCSAAGTATISNYDGTQTYNFSPTAPSAVVGGTISSMIPGTNYTVTAFNGTCSSVATTTFSIDAQLSTPSAPIAGSDTLYCSNATPVNLIAQGTGTIAWYSDAGLSNNIGTGPSHTPAMNLGTTNYYVTQTENSCEGPVSILQITVQECSIIIPTAITPDNDGVNETWVLSEIDKIYPKNVVDIYNRWGNLIYQSKVGKYEEAPWDGFYNSKKLPVGSYYYIIEYNDGFTTNKTGIVTIIE